MRRDMRSKYSQPPVRVTDIWRNVNLPREDAVKVLNAARWPNGQLAGLPDAVEVSESKEVSVYELVGAMQVAHARRHGKLTGRRKKEIRTELRKILGTKRFSDADFNDLFERLNI